ncbi:Zinc/iron permease [Patellaria atrata CBS 101060]|uniref:Zinc/iron permease n=1 Tax=Patellaria atrata CBS 101060 TaxID=1346257 RepID=A0A9P4VPI1_9PEZI|nr:Zinc/iron permease [Patellaria atrata CBS 101060]
MTAHDGLSPIRDLASQWLDIPTAVLQAELRRRQEETNERPPCGTKGARASYNTPLHVFALALILILSTLACSFPIIVRRFPRLPVPHHFLFLSRHFGTGVLIATAFVHLLPTAFVSLTDPCLPPFWNESYPAMPGLIAMTSVLIVVGIEMFFASRGAGHIHGSEWDTIPSEEPTTNPTHHMSLGLNRPERAGHNRTNSFSRFRQGRIGIDHRPPDILLQDVDGASQSLIEGRSPTSPLPPPQNPKPDDGDSDSDLSLDELDPIPTGTDSTGLLNGHPKPHAKPRNPSPNPYDPSPSPAPSITPLTPLQHQKKLLLQCLLLEAGILFHSVFIGMALSVSVGPPFLILLLAISFHQTFEGLALGSRISALAFPSRSPKPWLMALAYGTTTPLGQAIGLGVHNLYDPASRTGLLMVGVMNAISSGLLLFAGLVELLAEDFLSDASYVSLTGRRRVEACAAVVGGAALMALVGAWA